MTVRVSCCLSEMALSIARCARERRRKRCHWRATLVVMTIADTDLGAISSTAKVDEEDDAFETVGSASRGGCARGGEKSRKIT